MTNEEKILDLLSKHDEMLSQVQTTLTKVAVTQENAVIPQLKLLAEGHETLLEALAPKSRVEQMEEEIDLLKTAIRALSRDVAELKKAQ
ncbi:MAG TPA: hypothetical protein IAC25_02270 [Candidatus Enterenecus stercoripullorum]|nr:hypothetical protein [Candidatus Enterenecus stercoripullorum]